MNTNLEKLFAYIETLGWDVYCDGAGSVSCINFRQQEKTSVLPFQQTI